MHDGVQSRDAVTHGMILGFVPAFFVWGRQGPCTGCLAALDVINAMDYCSVENMNGPGQPPAQEMTFPAASRTAPAHLCSTKPAESGLSMIGHHGCTCAHPHAYAHTRTCVHTRALLNIHTHYVEACAFLVSTHIHTHRHAHTHMCARAGGAPGLLAAGFRAPKPPTEGAVLGPYWRRQYVFAAATMPTITFSDVGSRINKLYPDAEWIATDALHTSKRHVTHSWMEVCRVGLHACGL